MLQKGLQTNHQIFKANLWHKPKYVAKQCLFDKSETQIGVWVFDGTLFQISWISPAEFSQWIRGLPLISLGWGMVNGFTNEFIRPQNNFLGTMLFEFIFLRNPLEPFFLLAGLIDFSCFSPCLPRLLMVDPKNMLCVKIDAWNNKHGKDLGHHDTSHTKVPMDKWYFRHVE